MHRNIGTQQNDIRFETLKDCLDTVCLQYSEKVALRQIENRNREQSITFGELYERVTALGAVLLSMGYQGSHLGIIGENAIDWITVYLATVCGVGAAVPLDRELDLDTLAYQINFSDCDLVFITGKMVKKLPELQARCSGVRCWVIMRAELCKEIPQNCTTVQELIKQGGFLSREQTEKYRNATVQPGDLCDIIFTSGTTGANKSVMLSHRNITTVISGSLTHISVKENSQSFACLPIHHSYEKNCHVLCALALGYTLCINDDLMHLVQNLTKYSPCNSTMVPMIVETIERRIKAELKEQGKEQKFRNGVRLSNILRHVGIDRRDKLFHPILELMGNNLHQIVVGGAPLKEECCRFFDSIGISLINGYGISECAPLVAANFTDYQRMGSVGRVIPGCEVKIVDPNESGDGLILVRGSNVMMGYYKDPESTGRVLSEDGWLDTGDLGHQDKDGFLYITGRKKNLIILSNGKNVYPEEIEELLVTHIPYIQEVVVYTDEEGSGIFASVYLNPNYAGPWGDESPYTYVMADVEAFNKKMPSYKRIKDIMVVDSEFAKTTTRKIQRFKVEKVHQG